MMKKGLLMAVLFMACATINTVKAGDDEKAADNSFGMKKKQRYYSGFDYDFSLGANLTYMKFMGDEQTDGHAGVGIRAGFGEDSYMLIVGFNYMFPKSTTVTSSYETFDYNTQSYVTSSAEYAVKSKVYQIDLRANYYIVGEQDDDLGIYGTVGISYLIHSSTIESDLPGYEASESAITGGALIDLGLGATQNLEFAYVFLEGGISFPLFSMNSREGATSTSDLPSFWQINAGLRFPFD